METVGNLFQPISRRSNHPQRCQLTGELTDHLQRRYHVPDVLNIITGIFGQIFEAGNKAVQSIEGLLPS